MNYVIKSDLLTVTVSDKGAELMSVKSADGFEYMWGGDARYWGDRSPILFPTCGKLLDSKYTYGGKEYNMNGHGFAKKCVFEVCSKGDSFINFRLTPNQLTRAEYPFDFELLADFSVEGDNLSVKFTVKNNDEKVLPYMIGWHPGFVLDGDGKIDNFVLDFEGKKSLTWYPLQNGPFIRPYGEEYPVDEKYTVNEKEIYENDTMIFVGTGDKTLLYSPDTEKKIGFSWSENLPYFCIWKDDNSDARFLCLEPWSNVPADGITPENFETRTMSRLSSGESEVYSYLVKFF